MGHFGPYILQDTQQHAGILCFREAARGGPGVSISAVVSYIMSLKPADLKRLGAGTPQHAHKPAMPRSMRPNPKAAAAIKKIGARRPTITSKLAAVVEADLWSVGGDQPE